MSKMNSLYVSLLALVVALVALGMCIHCCAQKQSLSVEETLNNNPEIIINAMQNYEQKMREQAAAEAQKMIEANLPALNNDANTPFIGAADAKTVLVEDAEREHQALRQADGFWLSSLTFPAIIATRFIRRLRRLPKPIRISKSFSSR